MIKIVRTTIKKKMAGVAQGDSPSGLLFILALEPLLWKLALDLGVVEPVFENGSHVNGSSYPDDVSILVNGEPENLVKLTN